MPVYSPDRALRIKDEALVSPVMAPAAHSTSQMCVASASVKPVLPTAEELNRLEDMLRNMEELDHIKFE